VVSTAACGRRPGGGLALDGLFTGLDRAPERIPSKIIGTARRID